MNNFDGNITAQARELKLKAKVKDLQTYAHELEKKLITADAVCDELRKENDAVIAQNNFMKGQIDAYEKVLSHMIYSDTTIDEDDMGYPDECDGDCENCGGVN